jgi:hypothetical protein
VIIWGYYRLLHGVKIYGSYMWVILVTACGQTGRLVIWGNIDYCMGEQIGLLYWVTMFNAGLNR